MMKSRIFALRHVERDKSNTDNPQTPTPGGEITAYAMGMEIRKKHNPNFVDCTSSPQPRAKYTASIVIAGFNGCSENPITLEIITDGRLNDFSSDPREEIKTGVATAKAFAKKNGVEVEQAIHLITDRSALNTKVLEMQGVIHDLSKEEGDHLLAGLHGGSIDGAFISLARKLNADLPDGMGAHGGMFDKVEGFILEYEDRELISTEVIRQPDYLKTLAIVCQ